MLFTHSASFSSPVPPPEALSPPSQSNPGTSPPSSRSSRLRRLLTRDAGPSSPSSSTASSSHLSSTGLRRSNSEYIASSVPRSAHRVSATTNNNAQPHHPAAPAVSSRANNRLTLISSAPGPAPHRHHHRTLSDEPHLSHSLDAAIIEDATEQQHDSDQPSDREQQPQDQEYPVAAAEAAATSAPESSTAQTATMSRPRASTTGDAVSSAAAQAASTAGQFLPSIRLSAYYDPRSTRPSLTFPTVSRTLPTGAETIRVGRYSERDAQPPAGIAVGGQQAPSAAAVGFKSKVVSRRHCEFWYEGGKWFIRDVKSSSGTFLNHIRLSPPSQESRAFPVNDGDIVQLGIDFKGGEEMIFRCVKMRIELNRGWQTKLNTFK